MQDVEAALQSFYEAPTKVVEAMFFWHSKEFNDELNLRLNVTV